jgi:hypothetical protein
MIAGSPESVADLRQRYPRTTAAIEAEAVADAMAALRFEIEALDHTVVLGGRGMGEIHEPTRDAVLALIDKAARR